MKRANLIKSTKIKSSLIQFLGDDVQIYESINLEFNKNISCSLSYVNFLETKVSDYGGQLGLFPIDDETYFLELLYSKTLEHQIANHLIIYIRFSPEFFSQIPIQSLINEPLFKLNRSIKEHFSICTTATALIEQLVSNTFLSTFITTLQQNQIVLQLLSRALECIQVPFRVCQVPACRFLNFESEREKILMACRIISQDLDKAYSIKELSRKVAMNECYLKKGFRTIVGKTIHEYRESLRMDKAKELLIKGTTVTDVAHILGFSSISHFSTAFKRVTGLKPCELLSL